MAHKLSKDQRRQRKVKDKRTRRGVKNVVGTIQLSPEETVGVLAEFGITPTVQELDADGPRIEWECPKTWPQAKVKELWARLYSRPLEKGDT